MSTVVSALALDEDRKSSGQILVQHWEESREMNTEVGADENLLVAASADPAESERHASVVDSDAALELLQEMILWQEERGRNTEPVVILPPLPVPSPPKLPQGDNRFAPRKQDRVFVCDFCGHQVRLARRSYGTGWRYEGEFQGSYLDRSWANTFQQRSSSVHGRHA